MKRLLLRTAVLLAAVALASLLIPDVRWPLRGWVRGESFFRGRPTSYWSREVKDWMASQDWGCIPPPRLHTLPEVLGYDRTDWLERRLGIPPRVGADAPCLWEGDRKAVPVLVELLKDKDTSVAAKAASGLGRIGPEARGTVPALIKVLVATGADEIYFREEVVQALGRFGRDARAAAPALRKVSQDEREHVDVRCLAAEALKAIDVP
jgi:hypothetical protein